MRLIFFLIILPIIDRNGEGNGKYLCLDISHTKVSSSFIHAVAKGRISTFEKLSYIPPYDASWLPNSSSDESLIHLSVGAWVVSGSWLLW